MPLPPPIADRRPESVYQSVLLLLLLRLWISYIYIYYWLPISTLVTSIQHYNCPVDVERTVSKADLIYTTPA